MLSQLDQNGVLADALDHLPRNDEIVFPSKAKKTGVPRDHQREDPGIFLIKLKITGIS